MKSLNPSRLCQLLTPKEKKIFELARPHLQVMSNELHTREVVEWCLRLLQTVGGDRAVVVPAAILHDTGWAKIPESVSRKIRVPDGNPEAIKVHEEISALIAELILRDVRYKRDLIDEIVAMIRGHDSRKEALSLNDKILKDADKLSRYSKDFSKIWPLWGDGSAAENLYGELASGVKNWFFLADAKKMASMALDHLMQYDQTQTQI
jgi:HD superfamily phosphodiesterase